VDLSERCTLLRGTVLVSNTTYYELDDQSSVLGRSNLFQFTTPVQFDFGAIPVSCVMRTGVNLSERESDFERLLPFLL